LTGPEDDFTVRWNGMNMCHHAVANGNLSLLRALAERDVELDVQSDGGFTPLAAAIKTCQFPLVRFLLEHFRAQGREQDVVRDLTEKPTKNEIGQPFSLMFCVIQYQPPKGLSDRTKRDMVAFLVQELGMDIWIEGPFIYHSTTYGRDWRTVEDRVKEDHTFLPLHAAAISGNQPLLDFFFTECGMPVDTCTARSHLTALHFLALSEKDEKEILPIVKWLVGKKGADANCQSGESTAATIAFTTGKADVCQYLLAQGKRQAARKRKEEEEERKKAAAAATMVTRMRETEESIAALLLELEAEEDAAAANKKETKGEKENDDKKKNKKKK
jgi:ankyrin repeat protein